MGYYNKEVIPKAVTSSDATGTKRVGVSKVDREDGGVPSTTGAKAPKAAESSDRTGMQRQKIVGGVAVGKADGMGSRDESHKGHQDGRMGEMKGYVGEKVVYEHMRHRHDQDDM